MEFDIENILKNSEYFSFLSDEKRKILSQKVQIVIFKKNEVIFEKDQPSDCFYLVITGLLCAYFFSKKNDETIVGYINPGQTVGEMGLLADQPRGMSVKALRQSTLLKVTREMFYEYCSKDPELLTQFIRLILRRQTKTIEVLVNKYNFSNILLFPANEKVDIKNFENFLKKVIPEECRTSFYYASDYLNDKRKLADVNIDIQTYNNELTFFIVDVYDEEIIRFFYDHSDRIVLIGQGNTTPSLHPMVDQVFHHLKYKHLKKMLILIYQNNELPRQTSNWLDISNFASYHHIRENRLEDFATILRFFRGKAVGLVLGGGGGLGWVHLGAFKALQESNITVDVVGGVSIGAIVGGLYLCYPTYHDCRMTFTRIMESMGRPLTFRNFTYPIVSLLTGKDGTLALQAAFGDRNIEDLPKPYFCVTSNNNTAKEVIHTRGSLWKWNRASASVPWLLPPVVVNNEIHIDGGVMNNLPVDVMRDYFDGKGQIIAIDLVGLTPDPKKYSFPPIMPFWKSLIIKWTKAGKGFVFPELYDALIRTITLGSMHKLAENEKLADILVKPALDKYPTLSDANIKRSEELVQIGYEATLEKIKEFKKG